MKPLRIVILMPLWHPGFERRFCRLVTTLRSRNYDVTFCVLTSSMRVKSEVSLPAIPEGELRKEPFLSLGAVPIGSLRDWYRRLLNADLVIRGAGKGIEGVNQLILQTRRPVIECQDVGDQIAFTYPADEIAVPGRFFQDLLVLERHAEPSRLVITGDIRFDALSEPETMQRAATFFERYSLSSDRPVVVFCTGASQRQDPWTQALYRRIIQVLEDSGRYQPVIRLHPNDFAAHKRHHHYAAHAGASNTVLYPHVPCIEQRDVLAAMKRCAFYICVESSTCIESSLYGKNCLVVNLHEWCLSDVHRNQTSHFPNPRFNGVGLKNIRFDARIQDMQHQGILRPGASVYRTHNGRCHEFGWIGGDCSIDELPGLLKTVDFESVDSQACSWHLEHYWHRNDGKAHERLADLVEHFQSDPILSARLFAARGRQLWNYGKFTQWNVRYTAAQWLRPLRQKTLARVNGQKTESSPAAR
ncbi:MAG: hypothetical protein HYT88_06145 [Candidatus Omnitrophica bacterium]|nr:hypothetical protein [Candidatus Omnitrophota bacterium]MBI2173714.1 hypothetical protein [Candidatus Omnitrophota bacterium]